MRKMRNAIHDFQKQLTPQYCGNFINHLKKVRKLKMSTVFHEIIFIIKGHTNSQKQHGRMVRSLKKRVNLTRTINSCMSCVSISYYEKTFFKQLFCLRYSIYSIIFC